MTVGGAPGVREGLAEQLLLMSHERASTLPVAGGERALGCRRGCAGRFGSLGPAGFAWAAGGIDPLARVRAAQASQPAPAPASCSLPKMHYV